MIKSYTKSACFVVLLVVPAIIIANASEKSNTEEVKDQIIAMEKDALQRWNNGDPSGYLKIYGKEITYFDENTIIRLDGYSTLEKLYEPIKGKIRNARFEMIKPKVQLYGNVGVLTFNLITYSDEGKVTSRWNSTEVYSKIDGVWKIIHSHWSFTKHKNQRSEDSSD